jgi:hypothetical protein
LGCWSWPFENGSKTKRKLICQSVLVF